MVRFCASCILFLPVMQLQAAVVGWNNDGSSDFGAECRPPTAFNGETGAGVRWKTPLPNWSNSSPIVIAPADGKGPPRVVCLAEPLDYAPLLLCLDADTGRELWRRELDAVPLLPKEQQDDARAVARRGWAWTRTRKLLTAALQAFFAQNKGAWTDPRDPASAPAAAQQIFERAKAAGLEFRGPSQSAGGYPNCFNVSRNSPADQDHRRLKEWGLMWSEWDYQGTWDGVGYPTPLSDGRRIWTVTAHNLYSCHDLDGKVVWQVRFAPPKAADLTPEQKARLTGTDGKGRWPGAWPGAGGFSTSPLLVEDILVSNAGRMVRALDAATGKLLWAVPLAGEIGQCMAVPGVTAVGGERVVITVGGENRGGDGDALLRLKDGRAVGSLPGTTCSKCNITGPVVLGGDVVLNHQGTDVVAWRLAARDGAVVPERLWSLPQRGNLELWRPAWRDGLVYQNAAVLDARTGHMLGTKFGRGRGGYCGGGGVLAGPVHVSWDFYRGTFTFADAKTGAKIGEGVLPVNPPEGKTVAFKREQACRDDWRWLGAATPFAWKDRLYVRAYDFLWCLGPR